MPNYGLSDVGAVETVADAADLEVFPRIFDTELGVRVSDSGKIRLSLYSMDGHCLLSNTFNAMSGDTLRIYPDVPSGLYLLQAEKDGQSLGTAKVVRR